MTAAVCRERSFPPDDEDEERDVGGYEADDEEVDDDDDHDFEALLPRKRVESANAHKGIPRWPSRLSLKAILYPSTAALVVVMMVILVCKRSSGFLEEQPSHQDRKSSLLEYSCPATVEKSKNDKSDNFDWYRKDDKTVEKGVSLDDFRNVKKYDGWGISFQEVKSLIGSWKTEIFASNLKPGDKIYESACGAGLNLLLTSDILQEHDIYPITIYGNDYMSRSIDIANRLWEIDGAYELAQKGKFCQGDSTKLDFVPSKSFDLAYIGYIDPIMDPLQLMPENTTSVDAIRRNSRENCKNAAEVAAQEQALQEDWWASWVEELIRITKPGKPVVVENNGYAICTKHSDWGGVDKEFWAEAIRTRGWDIDPDSIVIEDMPRSEEWTVHRYHVMMRRNG